MGTVINWPSAAHVRASLASRAAKPAKSSAVIPADCAGSDRRTAAHHSAGILSRCHHLETAEAPAPIEPAIASRDGQSSMIERNEVCASMDHYLRQFVLNGNAILSRDCEKQPRQSVFMAQRQARSKFIADFLGRTVAARESKRKTQTQIAIAFGWGKEGQPTYAKYETRTPLPHELIDQFCEICDVSVEWLVTARGNGPKWQAIYPSEKTREKKPKKLAQVA